MGEVVEYRISKHPILWPVVGLAFYAFLFELPGIYFAAASHDPLVRLELRGTNAVIDIANHRSLAVAVFAGFLPFLDAVRARCPNAVVITSPRWERLRHR